MKPRNFRIISVNKEKKSCSCIKWWKTPKKKFKRKLIDIAHTKNSCDVEINWVKSLVMIRITRGLKNTKILAQKHINWLWFYLMKKELKKILQNWQKKTKSLTFEDELNSSIFIEFTCLHRSHLHWIFDYHGRRRWTSCRKTLWTQVEEFHKILLSTSY